ncbi:MAG TPA: glycosyltransferase family 39 protein [Candidatus Sulfotelmatobacter sp.]|nr:glycosyltransferase family 39 protein [Candidatus Sulfotelmatobacter sp.]
MEERNRLTLGIALVVAFLILFLRLGAAPLLDPDEARFARTSVEMMRSRDYVVPSFEGAPRLQKPPLLHWIQTALFRVAGPSELLARAPAAVSMFATVLLISWIGWRRFGDEGAAWSVAFISTFPVVVVIGRVGTLDALLAVHVTAVLALDTVQPEHGGLQRSAVLGGLLGLAFLAKGPVGVVLPLLMMLAGRTASGRDVLPSPKTVITALLAWCAVVLPWGLVFAERIGWGNVLALVRHEAVERAVSGTAHVRPWSYLISVSLVAFLPWVGPLIIGIGRAFARLRDPDSPTGPYAAAAFLAGLAFFSLSKGKLASYVLPLAPCAALIVVFELGQELVHPRKRRLGSALVAMTLVATAVALGVAAVGGALGLEGFERVQGLALDVAIGGAVLYAVGSLVSLYGAMRPDPRLVYGVAALTSAAFALVAVAASPPILAATRSAKPLVDRVPALSSSRPVVLVDLNLPSLTYYADRATEKVELGALAARLDRGDRPLVVVDEADMFKLPVAVREHLREVARGSSVVVYEPVEAASAVPERTQDESAANVP